MSQTIIKVLSVLILAPMWLWASLAIYFSNLPGQTFRAILAWGFAIAVAAAFAFLPNRRRTTVGFLVAFAAILVWFLLIPPSNDRDWDPSVAVLPDVTFDGDRVTIANVRNFDYKTSDDFKVRYYDRTYDLNKLDTMDLFLSYWDGNRAIAHTFLSFGFGEKDYVVISIETRPEKGEAYSAVSGFFRRFELIYVIGDERDIARVRTNHRSEDVYLYPLKFETAEIRKVFVGMLERANTLVDHPRWYNAFDQNCTSSIIKDLEEILDQRSKFSIDLLLNGYIDKLIYGRGRIVADVSDGRPFPAMRRLHAISEIAKSFGEAPDFSQKVRARLPARIR